MSHLTKKELEKINKKYAKKIKLNHIYYNDYLYNLHKNVVLVTSASFYSYLKYIFPKEKIIASEIRFDEDDRPRKIELHCKGYIKMQRLKEKGIEHIDLVYTDNISDLPLVENSKEAYIVKKEKKFLCSSKKEFLNMMGKGNKHTKLRY
jgi:phosphoserine phosphatase